MTDRKERFDPEYNLREKAVQIRIGDQEKKLIFDYAAFSELERISGMGINEFFSQKNLGFNTALNGIVAGLSWAKGNKYTLAKVAKMLDPADLDYYTLIVIFGYRLSRCKSEAEVKEILEILNDASVDDIEKAESEEEADKAEPFRSQ